MHGHEQLPAVPGTPGHRPFKFPWPGRVVAFQTNGFLIAEKFSFALTFNGRSIPHGGTTGQNAAQNEREPEDAFHARNEAAAGRKPQTEKSGKKNATIRSRGGGPAGRRNLKKPESLRRSAEMPLHRNRIRRSRAVATPGADEAEREAHELGV